MARMISTASRPSRPSQSTSPPVSRAASRPSSWRWWRTKVMAAGSLEPPAPASVSRVPVTGGNHVTILRRSHRKDEKGRPKTETTVALPHRVAPQRNKKLKKNKKIGQKGRGAYVEGIDGDEGNPWEEEEAG